MSSRTLARGLRHGGLGLTLVLVLFMVMRKSLGLSIEGPNVVPRARNSTHTICDTS